MHAGQAKEKPQTIWRTTGNYGGLTNFSVNTICPNQKCAKKSRNNVCGFERNNQTMKNILQLRFVFGGNAFYRLA